MALPSKKNKVRYNFIYSTVKNIMEILEPLFKHHIKELLMRKAYSTIPHCLILS